MKTPHKHAEVIKAWANGARIQHFCAASGDWKDCDGTPGWHSAVDYRIKPEPRKGWYRVALLADGSTFTADKSISEEELEQGEGFIRWLTPRIEYEVEE